MSHDLQTNLPPFLSELSRRVILCDGGMATMIYEKGIYINQSFENLNLERPHLIKNIHLEYVRAGAQVLETNTFSANSFKLSKYGLADKVREINLAGVRLAREAAEGKAWIGGVVGPPGAEVEGRAGEVSSDRIRSVYRQQLNALIEGGIDILFLESFAHLPTLQMLCELAREVAPSLPIVATVHIGADGRTRLGADAKEIGDAFEAMPADVVGVSDGTSPALLNDVLDALRIHTSKPLALLPGAGLPVPFEDRLLNMATPEYFMELLRKGINRGAKLVGGSSGCHPEHIRAINSSIKMLQPGVPETSAQPLGILTNEVAAPAPVELKVFETPSRFAAKIRANKFVVSVEIDPPVGTDATKSIEAAREAAVSGLVDCINIADGPRATARMGPIDMAMLLRDQVPEIEPIVHFCCRDRNILGMQADLIGANALGIHNILMITGDPPKLGDYPFATAVYDVDAIGALRIAANLNSGKDLAGNPLRGDATRLFLGAGANPGAIDLDMEIRRLEMKIEAGANYILTQPVYDFSLYERFHSRVEHLRIPILLGILPLASFRNAEFLTKEVPGMHVPEPIRKRLQACDDKESARLCGIDIAREALERALPTILGTYVMPPFNRVDSALAVLEVARSRIEA
ncbi:bifunctional homocysteine S-methyltransferase/methylenetetrahydrofolate reductase [Candidatus Sumerlaeota bacterium]|nr:bifunctional homocysteine S-methyltransferase/methylenetetrahydrofolate reductase [Candidatus Sumerlaeota bacterium]